MGQGNSPSNIKGGRASPQKGKPGQAMPAKAPTHHHSYRGPPADGERMPANIKDSADSQHPLVAAADSDGASPAKAAAEAGARKEGNAPLPTFGTMKPGVSFKNVVTLNASPAGRKYHPNHIRSVVIADIVGRPPRATEPPLVPPPMSHRSAATAAALPPLARRPSPTPRPAPPPSSLAP